MQTDIQTSLTPWLTYRDCAKAVQFYKNAFDAIETYRLESPDGGLVVQLSIRGAIFWLSSGSDAQDEREDVGGGTVRIILTVDDPYPIFEKAKNAGAKEIFPIGEGYGWLLGRVVDPFGLHWEIGHPLTLDH